MIGTALGAWRELRAARILDARGPGARVLIVPEKRAQGARISVGRDSFVAGALVAEAPGSVIDLHANVFVGHDTLVVAAQRVTIEDDVLVSYRCVIVDTDSHSLRYSERRGDLARWRAGRVDWSRAKTAPVRLCRGSWIGAGTIITKGVTVGEGAICGMGSVVTRDVEPYTIVAGNPARVVRVLGPEER